MRGKHRLAAPVIVGLLFLAAPAEAQITFRAAASATEPGAITFVGAGTQVVSTTKNGSLTPQIPAGAQANDLAIVFVAGRPSNPTEPSEPAGWTLRSSSLQEVGAEDLKVMTFYRVLQGGDSDPSFTVPPAWGGNGAGMSAAIAVWRGVDTATPFDVADVTGNSAGVNPWTPPSISIVTAGALTVSAVATSNDNALAVGTANGFTGRMTGINYDTITGGDHALGVAEYRQPWSGAVTMLTWNQTANSTPDLWAGITFALRQSSRALTITKPAGTIENDVMIASIAVRPNTVTITAPSGWTLVRRMDSATSTTNSLAVYRKVAGPIASEPASYTWTVSATSAAVGGIRTFAGVDTTTPVDVENGWATAPATTHSTPDVTTTVANTMLVTSHAVANYSTWSPPAGMTEAFDIREWSEALEGSYALQAAAGATGQKTATDQGPDGVDGGNAHILALRPPPACAPAAGYVWCYATSAAAMAPPALDPWSNIVVSGSNDNKLHGMTDAGGTLAFAPFTTGGPLQARPAMLPAGYRTPATTVNIAYVTSQDGYVYAVDTTTGAQVWQSPSLAAANMLQGGTNVWIQVVKALSICGVTTSDVVFVGTRNTGTTTANQVYALNGSSSTVTSTGGGNCVANGTSVLPGGILWTFTGGGANPNLDIISSVPYVDFTDDAVWVTSRAAGGTAQPSVWKLNASNGTLATGTSTWNFGNIDSAPFPGANGTYMYVGTNAGDLKAIRVSDGAVFTHTPTSGTGAIKGQPWPLWYDAVGSGGETIVFSRDVTVHSVNFNGSTFTPNWAKTLTKLVQQNTGGGNPVTSLTVTLTTPTTAGNVLVMVGAGWCWSLAAPTGGGVTSWSKAASSLTNTNIEIWYGVVSTSSSTGVTIAMSNASTCALWMNLTEWSGLTQSPVLDNAGSLAGTGTPASASTGATTNPNDLLIFGVSQSSGSTFGAPTLGGTPGPWSAMTAITTPAMQSSWYQVVSATGTYNPSVSVTTAWDAAIAAFKVATVSAPIEDYAGRIYVGGSDGKVHELNVATGADQKQVPTIPIAGTMGEPTINWDLGRIHVGGSDGRIYTFAMPF